VSIHVVVGGQYGSEAKGHVTDQVIRQLKREDVKFGHRRKVFNIRVGGPNAGHTVIDENGNKFPLRQVPVGAVTGAVPMIGPGSEIDIEVLAHELDILRESGHEFRLYVHSEATVLTAAHKAIETAADLHGKIGSTGKGIGAARAARIMREANTVRQDADLLAYLATHGVKVMYPWEWTRMINQAAGGGDHIVVVGVQGYGLGLHAGHYPQSTTADSTAVDFLSAAGVSPWASDDPSDPTVWVVAREFPIRVAGNSGPLHNETTWAELGLPEERTTVTQKVRRVGQWDPDLIRRAVEANGGFPHAVVVLTMIDQRFPDLVDTHSADGDTIPEDHPVWDHIKRVQEDAGTTVVAFTTSPTTIVWL
jgi:adenylosuccinate synthase